MTTNIESNTKLDTTVNADNKPEKKKKKKKKNGINDFFARMGVLGELLGFLWRRKLYWLIPMMVTLLLFAVLIAIGSSGPGGVFIYTLF